MVYIKKTKTHLLIDAVYKDWKFDIFVVLTIKVVYFHKCVYIARSSWYT